MRLDENLNLVLPIREDEKGNPLAWAFHTPISKEVFEANFRILSLVKGELFSKGLAHAYGNGPRICGLMLKEESKKDAEERDLPDMARTFMNELKRLTMIVAPGPEGFRPLPVDAALSSDLISEEEWEDAENAILFFTLIWSLSKRSRWKQAKEAVSLMLNGRTESFSCTEFAASLGKSTEGTFPAVGELLVRL